MAESVTEAKINLPSILLATKLYVPPRSPNLVARPNLIAQLDSAIALGHKLILLSAPPGFGKTTLLSEWANPTESSPASTPKIAWLSLDEADNEPRQFLLYAIAALQRVEPQAGQTTLAALREKTAQPVSLKSLLAILINEVSTFETNIVMVLDDYHFIEAQTIHSGLLFLLENLPPRIHLVVSSRTDLPFSLARFRGRGQVTELHSHNLRFSARETSVFLGHKMGLTLLAEQVAALETRTEGWIAGLQMAALSMQGRPAQDTATFVKAFTGSHRYILDYLLEEVLQRQPEHIQHFLLQTSILDRLCGPLCDAMLQGARHEANAAGEAGVFSKTVDNSASGQEILEQLERRNLFLVPLDDQRQWYRYHRLFAELLRQRLTETLSQVSLLPMEPVAVLHRYASDWFESEGLVTEAMQHALATMDIERIIRLAKQTAAQLLSRTEQVTMLNWLDALPEKLEKSQVRVSLLHAWAMVLTGQLELVETHLQDAASSGFSGTASASFLGEVAMIRGLVAYLRRDMPQSVEMCRQSLQLMPPDNLFLRGIVLQTLGSAHRWCGQVIEATHAYTQAEAMNHSSGNVQVGLIAMWNLGELWSEQGGLQQAIDFYRQGLQRVAQLPTPEQVALQPFTGRLHIGLAGVLLQQNMLEQAAQHLQTGIALGKAAQESGMLTGAHLILARLHLAQGQPHKAQAALHEAVQLAQRYNGPHYWATQVDAQQAHLWLTQGDAHAVAAWLKGQGIVFDPLPDAIAYLQEEEYVVLARLLWFQGQHGHGPLPVADPFARVVQLTTMIIEAARPAKRIERLLDALLLQLLCLQQQGLQKQAVEALKEVLAFAEPEGYVRIFVDAGPWMQELLRLPAVQSFAPSYCAKLLAAFPATHPSTPLLDPLSEREIEILAFIAGGLSNQELADELILTVGTVKWHLNNIYSKLAVRSRTQAVAKARELGLI